MIKLTELQQYLDDYLYFDKNLDLSTIDPFMTNGLMVKGCDEVNKIGFGVSASVSLFEKAMTSKCDAIIVHHSFNLPAYNHFDSIFQNRIGFLIKNGISLFGYHFLLDAHPNIGHNVQIIKKIGARPIQPYLHKGNPWGWIGEFEKVSNITEIENRLKPYLSNRATFYQFGNKKVKKLVTVSGMGAPLPSVMHDLINDDIDLFITGEAHEWNRELFREAKINFIAGGHYHSEKFGLLALMEKVKTFFSNVQVEWLELKNEI